MSDQQRAHASEQPAADHPTPEQPVSGSPPIPQTGDEAVDRALAQLDVGALDSGADDGAGAVDDADALEALAQRAETVRQRLQQRLTDLDGA